MVNPNAEATYTVIHKNMQAYSVLLYSHRRYICFCLSVIAVMTKANGFLTTERHFWDVSPVLGNMIIRITRVPAWFVQTHKMLPSDRL